MKKDAEMEHNLKLYVDSQFASAWAMSAFVALEEKELPFEVETLILGNLEHRRDDYAKASLSMRVPMLQHGGFSLSESTAIAEYLNDCFDGPNLFPEDPKDRARARQIQAWLRSDFAAVRSERDTTVLFRGPVATELSLVARREAEVIFSVVEQLLDSGRSTLFGQWSIADTDLSAMINRLALNGDPVPEMVERYARKHWNRPSVQAWVQRSKDAMLDEDL